MENQHSVGKKNEKNLLTQKSHHTRLDNTEESLKKKADDEFSKRKEKNSRLKYGFV